MVYVKVYLCILLKRNEKLKSRCNTLPGEGNVILYSMLKIVLGHLPHLWCHLSCVLSKYSQPKSQRWGWRRVSAHLSELCYRPGACWLRRRRMETQGAQNSSSNPLAWAGQPLRSLSPLGEQRKTGPSLGSPRRKVQWWSIEWKARNGLNAGQIFLSLFIPKWHFNCPEFKILLPFSMPNTIFGNVIKSRREETQFILKNNNFKINTVTWLDSSHSLLPSTQDFLKSAHHLDPSVVEEDVPHNWWASHLRMETPDSSLGFQDSPALITFWGVLSFIKNDQIIPCLGDLISFPMGFLFWLPKLSS